MYPMTMDDLSALKWEAAAEEEIRNQPVFLKGILNIDEKPCDTFVKLEGFTKGFVVVNGFNIGRYFNPAGPQKTLYVPAPLLREGENEIIVFESDSCAKPQIEFLDVPELG
jgi:beta-galactosidase